MAQIPPIIYRILDLARWAPSGDNTQPWKFEILGPEHVLIHGFDTRDHVVYDLDGHSSHLAVGALLETIAIAATSEGYTSSIYRRPHTPDTHLLIDVRFERKGAQADSLVSFIKKRAVQRRRMSSRKLTQLQKEEIADCLPDGYRVIWYEGFSKRWQLARFMFDNAKVRLVLPEAYLVHRSVIEWGARFSMDKIPGEALGVNSLTAKLMQWAMSSWERVEFLNKWAFGHVGPRIELDLLPGLACGAHFALLAPSELLTVDDYLEAGGVMQRCWLKAESLGLYIQPEMTPVIFNRYYRTNTSFTRVLNAYALVEALDSRLSRISGGDHAALFFMGRIGNGPKAKARSTRKSLESLILAQ